MAVPVVNLVREASVSQFKSALSDAIDRMEFAALSVEVHYAVGLQHGGAGADPLYTALIIGHGER